MRAGVLASSKLALEEERTAAYWQLDSPKLLVRSISVVLSLGSCSVFSLLVMAHSLKHFSIIALVSFEQGSHMYVFGNKDTPGTGDPAVPVSSSGGTAGIINSNCMLFLII